MTRVVMAARRPAGAPAVHSLDHIVLAVPDLTVAGQFFEAFGLEVQSSPDGLDLFCVGSAHRWMTIRQGNEKRLEALVFAAYARDIAGLREYVQGIAPSDLQFEDDGYISFRDPDGLPIRIVVAEKSTPDAKSLPSAAHNSVAAGHYAAPLRSKAPKVAPRRFAHALCFSSDVGRATEFYCSTLGLALSDEAGGEIAFLHGVHGSDHHLVGFAQGGGSGLHHTAWDVGSVQEVGLGMLQMARAGYGEGGWGLGRHVLGSNYFHYVRDPWNSYAEYSFDIDYVPAGHQWKTGHLEPEDGFYLWGPAPPPDFAFNYEARRD